MQEAQAWVLHRGEKQRDGKSVPGELVQESFIIPDLGPEHVLAEPLYGCWEGNMGHALQRVPVDICRLRREDKVVIGNAGVVRVLETGSAVTRVRPGDLCLVFCNAEQDEHGYPVKVLAYDASHTMGLLARRTRLPERVLVPIPRDTRHSLKQWAAFSLRYITAWSNWRLAYGCWRLQVSESDCPAPFVVGWGGGVSYAQLRLARYAGCRVAMVASQDERLRRLASVDIIPIDRREFPDLMLDPALFASDSGYRQRYTQSEKRFLARVKEAGRGQDVSIFLDHIGAPLFQATLKALGRQGVIATAGWKLGAELIDLSRSTECTKRHQHIHTHYARYSEAVAAVGFAEEMGWLPPVDGERVYTWEEIPQLARDVEEARVASYFPLFQVNPEAPSPVHQEAA
ncbi:zinc-binding alcohol dehydrogenase family protein [Myxococcus llanfairpwllgwyngyllgogerychwyrndrobwllllantysiliogogogochensis]|uniref:Zinc-binding alcohol dehydrogenase family protein n=1 Tax=Myxococcus llanfairpwllgwyngyllgogerychwyrndrobwllllantysiliogogogochensis TaxID=2590453 RepID=A0A540X6C1_9BACT|nr:zinc-binding dehydrogenase [Myxococcus llanfairpwllgwyngyllgogerychwyrndrobwllllantysiliogogogochensis]TQF16815.1 zinc-binding alcohol dehydrogenase family protein [Myxococcus llanfairpwllgwyngyllgogerychwyrndrobwllllantysiliogogogochensis]